MGLKYLADMAIGSSDFWRLLAESQLVPPAALGQLRSDYLRAGLPQDFPAVVARWLIVRGILSPYQAKVLLAGRAGPFFVGEFRLDDRNDSGRLSGLFQATHLESQRPALLWLFPKTVSADRLQEVIDCAKRVAAAKHPMLLRCYGTVRAQDVRLAVLERFDGDTLAERLGRRPLPAKQACRVTRQIAQALSALHALNFVHGDVRPDNVLVDESGRMKLLHFPLARNPFATSALDFRNLDDPRLRRAVNYAAPQLAAGDQADVAADIYALGCLLFEMLTGRVPFPGGNPVEKMSRHASEPIRGLLEAPGVSSELVNVVESLMAKDAALRTSSALDAARILKPFSGPDEPLTPFEPTVRSPVAEKSSAPSPRSDDNRPDDMRRNNAIPDARDDAASSAFPQVASVDDFGHPLAPTPHGIDRPPIESILGETAGNGSAALARIRSRRRKRRWIGAGVTASLMALAATFAFVAWQQGWLTHTSNSLIQNQQTADRGATGVDTLTGDASATNGGHRDADAHAASDSGNVAANANAIRESPPGGNIELINDDGETLWVSPTDGAPIDLDYLPAGFNLVFVMRPAEFLANPASEKLLAAMGPAVPKAQQSLESVLGSPLSDIEFIKLALYYAGDSAPRMAIVAELKEPGKWSQISANWSGVAVADSVHGATCWRGGQYSYFAPANGDDRWLVVGIHDEISETIAQPKPILRKEIERLLRETDEQRQFTLLFAPRDLIEGEGRHLLAGSLDRLRRPLEEFFAGADIKFGALSMQIDDRFFVELRLQSAIETDPRELAASLMGRLSDLPAQVESHLATVDAHPYGKLLLMRLPRMLHWLQEYSRGGVESRQTVLRAYLPAVAAHNLLMAAELALADPSGKPPAAVVGTPRIAPVSAADALKTKISLSFSKDTLEKSLELLSKEIDVEIVIMGADLQLDGITKNQSFELNERDRPAIEVLETILKKANPDGKLVYIIKPQGGRESLFITTRSQAQRRGDPLPQGIR